MVYCLNKQQLIEATKLKVFFMLRVDKHFVYFL
jgi:hypothetical protein